MSLCLCLCLRNVHVLVFVRASSAHRLACAAVLCRAWPVARVQAHITDALGACSDSEPMIASVLRRIREPAVPVFLRFVQRASA